MTPRRIRALVVDDQPIARERILALLSLEDDVDVVGTCATGAQAVQAIRTATPDVVFLDMQMPERDGLGVVEAIGIDHMPLTIFVTAYEEYAVRAFEAQAVDYLLKPFARPRFARAVARARERLNGQEQATLSSRRHEAVEATEEQTRSPHQRLMVKSAGRVLFVDVPRIDWVEAESNYARLYMENGEQHLVRCTMNELLVRLGEERFARVHRSAIVNVSRITALRVAQGGDYDVVLGSGATVPLSRSCRDQLQARLAAGTRPRA